MTREPETLESLAWGELQRRGSIPPRHLRSLEREVSRELARCLDPAVHEQVIRPYGAIVCRETPQLERLGRIVDTASLAPPFQGRDRCGTSVSVDSACA